MALQRYNGNWASCISQLKGGNPADGKEVIVDRMERYEVNKKDREHFDKGTWLVENTDVVDGQILMARAPFNVLVPYAEQATKAHADGMEFYLGDAVQLQGKPAKQVLVEVAKTDKDKILRSKRVFTPSNSKSYSVSWDKFGDDDVIVWHAQGKKLAKDYGRFLHNDCGIDSANVNLPATNLGDIVRGNWLYRLDGSNRFDFFCNSRSLYIGDGSVFGGFVSGEASAPKKSEGKVRIYTPTEARKYVSILSGVMQGKKGTASLKEVLGFFERKK